MLRQISGTLFIAFAVACMALGIFRKPAVFHEEREFIPGIVVPCASAIDFDACAHEQVEKGLPK